MPIGVTELRLLWAVLLNGTVLSCAFVWVARIGRNVPRVQRTADALLVTYLVQYASVGLPGILGILSPATMSVTALLCSGAMLALSVRRGRRPPATQVTMPTHVLRQQSVFIAACVFAICYLAANVYVLRFQPVIATDALTYHFPAALHWLRTGRLSIFPTWFFNPANTYSPLAGSTFIAWLIAPEGNDVIARFVQAPAMLLIFFATVQLCRQVMQTDVSAANAFQSRDDSTELVEVREGAVFARTQTLAGIAAIPQSSVPPRTPLAYARGSEIQSPQFALLLAGVIAVGVIACRPLLGEAALGKDDLFLTAFLIVGIASFAPNRLRDRLGPWRIGIALGLCLAIKYTSLLALPLFLLLVDAPFRAGWRRRQFIIVLGAIALVAGPWYLRNLWITGNPVYPLEVRIGGHTVLPGLFQTLRSVDLRSLSGIWQVLARRYHSIPLPLLSALALGWLTAVVTARGQLLRDPIVRIALLGPPIGLALFICFSPYPEVRFVFSSLVLLFVASAVALSCCPLPHCVRIGWVLFIAIVSVSTGYRAHALVAACAGVSLVVAAAAGGLYFAQHRTLHLSRRAWAGVGAAAAIALTLIAYVYWNAYVNVVVGKSDDPSDPNGNMTLNWWRLYYAKEADAWNYMRQHTPSDAITAYANTSLVYPLISDDRRAIYIPTRHGVQSLRDLPHFPTTVSGEQIIATVTALLDSDSDPDRWLQQLLASGAGYLVIAKNDAGPHPPEISIARADPKHFEQVFEDENYVIFRIIHPKR